LESRGSDLSSDVSLSAFGLVLTDPGGSGIPDPARYLRTIRVHTALQVLADRPFRSDDGEAVNVFLTNPLSLDVNLPVTVILTGDIAPDAPYGVFQVGLMDTDSFVIRDANTNHPVPVLGEPASIAGNPIRIEHDAERVEVSGAPEFPAVLSVGRRSVPALTAVFRHPSTEGTARIRVESLTVRCRDQESRPLAPGLVLNRVTVLREGQPVGEVVDPPTDGGSVPVPLNDFFLEPGESAELHVEVDIAAAAPATWLELMVGAPDIDAVDANREAPVPADPAPGASLPLFSGLTRLEPPARELAVSLRSLMPPVLVPGAEETPVGVLTLANADPEGSGLIRIMHLTVRADDGTGTPVAIGRAAARIVAYRDGEPWATSAALTPDSTTAEIHFPETLYLEAATSTDLEIRLVGRDDTDLPRLRLGWTADGVGVVQPAGALFEVLVRPEAGRTFPLWTDSGTFSAASLAGSWSNFPNPFAAGREDTRFVYYLPREGTVTLRIYTPRGDEVLTLVDGAGRAPGLHQSDRWTGRNGRGSVVRNGVYIAEFEVVYGDGTRERLLRKVAVVR